MIKTIINDDFMLHSKEAKELYKAVKDLPIIDYHCHLVPEQIANDHKFSDIGELFLAGDHYKWRAMRSWGIDEKYITGDASFHDKFIKFAEMLPNAIGNPLYHWTHLELKKYFGINEALTPESAERIYEKCTALLQKPEYSARGLISMSSVETVCTTDDPSDNLEYHKMLKGSDFKTLVLPTFRPDKAVNIHKQTFIPYIGKIGVRNYDELKSYMKLRIGYFHEMGARLSDHGLDFIPFAVGATHEKASEVFENALNGKTLTTGEIELYMTDMLLFFAREYAERGWCMQIHVGAIRDNNTPMYQKLGPDTGFDSVADGSVAAKLSSLLDTLEIEDKLPKTILYSLNQNDNYALATLMGCFQKAPFKSKIQLGSGWWFNDQRDGMENQLRAFGNLGVLGGFVGMLTDSRSFVSYPRHDYFRRILCNLFGDMVARGEYPRDMETLKGIVRAISYENAKNYFQFGK